MNPPMMASELELLAREANGHFEAAEAFGASTKKHAMTAVSEVLLCGCALAKVKESLKHGQYMKWLKTYCPKISNRTAQKYVALANANHDSYLKDATSIRQAYQLCGIIPADVDTDTTANTDPKPTVITVEAFERFAHRIEGRSGEVATWPEDKREKLKTALKPIVDLYQTLDSAKTIVVEAGE